MYARHWTGSPVRATVALLAATMVVAGCGTETLDQADLEGELRTQLGESAGAEPESVSCPDDIEASTGTSFSCTLVAPNGDEVTVEGEVTNDEGGFEARVVGEGG